MSYCVLSSINTTDFESGDMNYIVQHFNQIKAGDLNEVDSVEKLTFECLQWG